MKKVLQVITSLSDGGAETLVKDYALLLDKQRFETKIVVIQNVIESANYRRLSEAGVSIIPVFKHYNYITRALRAFLGWAIIPVKLHSIITQEKPEVIHIHLKILKYFVEIRNCLTNRKLFYTCHNVPTLMFENSNGIEKKSAMTLIKENGLQMIALHKEMSDEINEMFHIESTKVIRNGVDFRKFRNVKESKESIRASIGIPKDAFVIGHIGRFSEQKNHRFLIRIFAELHKVKPNAFLLLVGEGSLCDSTMDQIRQQKLDRYVVHLTRRTDIPQLLKSMDVFVFPSLFEGLSVTLVEAQVAGTKCVVSNMINPETILSPTTLIANLNDSALEWVKLILDENAVNPKYGDINLFDINQEIHNLEDLYLGDN